MATVRGNPAKLKPFKKGDPRINRKGAPPRFVSTVIRELEQKGIENVKPTQVIDLYEKMMNCSIIQLNELANDENAGWEVRQTAKYMLKYPEKAWNEIKDRAHGKAGQKVDMTGSIVTTPTTITLVRSDRLPSDVSTSEEEIKKSF